MPKQCYFCKGEIQPQKITIDFRWGEELIVIEKVPAMVCLQCGEKYFDVDVSRQLEKLAQVKTKTKRTIEVAVRDFDEVMKE